MTTFAVADMNDRSDSSTLDSIENYLLFAIYRLIS